jgi:hypothetical protein
MKTNLFCRAALIFVSSCILIATLPMRADDLGSQAKVVPQVMMTDAPLSQAIELLAQQAGMNYIVDTRLSFESAPMVNFHWYNVTAKEALERLLKERSLDLVENPATLVARIAPRNLHVKPVDPTLVGDDTNGAPGATIQMTDAPLAQGIELLAKQMHRKAIVDIDSLKEPSGKPISQSIINFRWKNVTAKQALVALLDNYDLVMTEESATSTIRITARAETIAIEEAQEKNTSMTHSNSWITVLPQLAFGIPVLAVCLVAGVLCVLRWRQSPSVALFCLLGFGLFAFSTFLSPIISALIMDGMSGDHRSMAKALGAWGLIHVLINTGGLVFLLLAVFSGREQKVEGSPFESASKG